MIYALVAVLVVAWVLGFGVFQVGGSLVHALLVIAAIVIVWRLLTGRRPVA